MADVETQGRSAGELLGGPAVAIVGTREATNEALSFAHGREVMTLRGFAIGWANKSLPIRWLPQIQRAY